ncbi:hypothetical protein ACS0TY_032238 [Phlomoides rotata]
MNEQRDEIRNAQNIAENFEEMINVIERLNGRLESDIRAIKAENSKLLYEKSLVKDDNENGFVSVNLKLWINVSMILLVCLWLKTFGGESVDKVMLK